MRQVYDDRAHAAAILTEALSKYRSGEDVLLLGLPRGGVPVACGVAEALNVRADALVVRKLGVPGEEELAMGAVASGGIRVLNQDVIDALGISNETIERVTALELEEVRRRERAFRGDRPPPELRGQRLILVDDGIATGATMRAAIAAVRTVDPTEVVVAIPVAPLRTIRVLEEQADTVVCPLQPEFFFGISEFYRDFRQVEDDEVREALSGAWAREAQTQR